MLLIFFLFLSTNLFSGNDFSVYIIEANINARSTYHLQSNSICRQIEQDQNNHNNINACWMVSLAEPPSYIDRNIRYFYSSNGGSAFEYIREVTATRSGFPVLDVLSDGRVIIGCHSNDFTGSNTTIHLYSNNNPGSSVFTAITAGSVNGLYPIWPQITLLPNSKIFFTGGGQTGFVYRNHCSSLTPPGIFSGYSQEPDIHNLNLTALASSEGKTGLLYIGNDMQFGKILLKESIDGGITFGNSQFIWNYNNDSLGGFRGIDLIYDGNIPNVVFEVGKIYGPGIHDPFVSSKIYFWSPAINNGLPKLIDSAGGLTGHGFNSEMLSVCRPVIGLSNPAGLKYIAYLKARSDTNSEGNNYFDVNIAYSSDGGQNWSIPQQITNTSGDIADYKYVSISGKNKIINNTAEVHLLFQYDSIPQINVPALNSYKSRMMYAKLSMPVIGVEPISSIQPEKFILKQNYPNPFNPVTQIEFSVPVNSFVKLKVYNSAGELVSILAEGEMARGSYKADFNAANLASGVYYYVMEYNEENSGRWNSISKKMVLIK